MPTDDREMVTLTTCSGGATERSSLCLRRSDTQGSALRGRSRREAEICDGRNAQSLAKALERGVPSDTDDVAPEHALQVEREERDAEADGFGESGLVHVCEERGVSPRLCVARPTSIKISVS